MRVIQQGFLNIFVIEYIRARADHFTNNIGSGWKLKVLERIR